MPNKVIKIVSYVLVIIGALNWGLVGLFDFDLVATIFGDMTFLTRLVYVIVGLSAIVSAISVYMCCKNNEIKM